MRRGHTTHACCCFGGHATEDMQPAAAWSPVALAVPSLSLPVLRSVKATPAGAHSFAACHFSLQCPTISSAKNRECKPLQWKYSIQCSPHQVKCIARSLLSVTSGKVLSSLLGHRRRAGGCGTQVRILLAQRSHLRSHAASLCQNHALHQLAGAQQRHLRRGDGERWRDGLMMPWPWPASQLDNPHRTIPPPLIRHPPGVP